MGRPLLEECALLCRSKQQNLRSKRLRIRPYYGVCDRDGVGDAVASVWLIADALNGGGVWLIADASVWLIDEAAGTTVQTQLPRLAHGCAEMHTF